MWGIVVIQRVLVVIPATIAEIDSTDKRQSLINHHRLLMMAPERCLAKPYIYT